VGLRGGLLAAAGRLDEAVKDLRANPSPVRQKQFDDIFGAGAAKGVLGTK